MITGGAPASGFRIALDRGPDPRAPYIYRGTVALPETTYTVVAAVAEDLSVHVTLDSPNLPAPATLDALAEKVRLLVRQVVRQSQADAEPTRPPARKIVRWRGEK